MNIALELYPKNEAKYLVALDPQPRRCSGDLMWFWKDCQWMHGGLGFPESGIEDHSPFRIGDPMGANLRVTHVAVVMANGVWCWEVTAEKVAPKIYLLYSCDDWKSTNSMKLVTASTTKEGFKKAILAMLSESDKGQEMIYSYGELESPEEQVSRFEEDWAEMQDDGFRTINEHLGLGYIEVVGDGEVL